MRLLAETRQRWSVTDSRQPDGRDPAHTARTDHRPRVAVRGDRERGGGDTGGTRRGAEAVRGEKGVGRTDLRRQVVVRRCGPAVGDLGEARGLPDGTEADGGGALGGGRVTRKDRGLGGIGAEGEGAVRATG